MITLNYEEVLETGPIAEGEYEIIVKEAKEDNNRINMQLQIRNDIDQHSRNRIVFHTIWKSKQTGQYHSGIINTIAKALQLPNGKQYSSIQELLGDFMHKTALVKIEHEEYNGKTYERAVRWGETKEPECTHKFKEEQPFVETSQDAADDLPF